MRLDKVDAIANAVLYEGFVLYPYRASSKKNRVRWTFGGIHPRAYSEATGGAEPDSMQTQVLLIDGGDAHVEIRVRFLHLVQRTVGRLLQPLREMPEGALPSFDAVDSLRVGDTAYQTWQEAVERTVETGADIAELVASPRMVPIKFAGSRTLEPARGSSGRIEAVLVRQQEDISASVEISALRLQGSAIRLTVRILNDTPMPDADGADRDRAMMLSMASTHTVLGVRGGDFVSLADPPEPWREVVSTFDNQGTWPAMVGSDGDTDMMLSSRIILEDYPRVAEESPGDLFDGAEIDEILTLRILTLTDDEREEAMSVDPSVRAMLERTAALTPDQMRKMHGAVRGMKPVGGGGPEGGD
jgi:hydrogenase maturation protease